VMCHIAPVFVYHSTLSAFFSYAYPDPRSLHSFPTRRSSDLVVLDVDLGARLLLDPPHDLAAGADDLADLLLTDLDRDEPGRIGAELGPRLLDRLAHLGEHGLAGLARLTERRTHDLE